MKNKKNPFSGELYDWQKNIAKDDEIDVTKNFPNLLTFCSASFHLLEERSQTRGPREGPMRPANFSKNQDFY